MQPTEFPTTLIRTGVNGLLRLLIFLLAMAVAAPALAQSAWPNKPVRIVVPFAPGGFTDIIARYLATQLSTQLQQPFIVDNRPGAATALGAEQVARASPDGYTLLLNGSYELVFPLVERNYRIDELRHIALVAGAPYVLVTGPRARFNTLRELVEAAKTGNVRAGSAFDGSQGGVALKAFAVLNGFRSAEVVPQRGPTPLITALASGELDVAVLTIGQAGNQVRPLAIMDSRRHPLLPDLPTVKEIGLVDVQTTDWYVLAVPTATPEPLRARISSAVALAVRTPDMAAKFNSMGLTTYGADEASAEKAVYAEREFLNFALSQPGSAPNPAARSAPVPPQSSVATVAPPAVSGVEQWRQRSAALAPAERQRASELFRSGFDALKAGDGVRAANAFGAGLGIDPGNGSAHFYQGEALLLIGRRAEAVPQWRAARDLAPNSQEGQLAVERLRQNAQME